jgi:hypothetical protein
VSSSCFFEFEDIGVYSFFLLSKECRENRRWHPARQLKRKRLRQIPRLSLPLVMPQLLLKYVLPTEFLLSGIHTKLALYKLIYVQVEGPSVEQRSCCEVSRGHHCLESGREAAQRKGQLRRFREG